MTADHTGSKRRPLSCRRRIVFASLATLIGLGFLSGLDHSAGYFFYQKPARSLLFPSGSLVGHDSCEFSVTVKISDAGIRDRYYQAGAPQEGTTRVVAVGDSFTFGWGVENDEAWPNVLERQLLAAQNSSNLNSFEVLNFGYPGASPIGYEQSVAQSLQHFQPQVVVLGLLQGDDLIQIYEHEEKQTHWSWQQLHNDIFPTVSDIFPTVSRIIGGQPNPDPMRSYRETFYLSNQYIRSQFNAAQHQRYQSLPSGVRQAFEAGLLNPSLIQTSMNRPKYFSEPLEADATWRKKVSERLEGILVRTDQQCRAAGCQLVVAIVPNGPYVSRLSWEGMRDVGYQVEENLLTSNVTNQLVNSICQQNKITFIDVTNKFRVQNSSLYFKWDGHFNRSGQQLFGSLLAKRLKSLLP